jgi:hypothetical protein
MRVDQYLAVDVEREALLRVAELRRKLRHRDALGDLHRRLPVPQVVRMVVRDPGHLARAPVERQ